ncbi:MAG: UDP-N-acetylmuramoyl-tripeptide--D-alanyl-D-alanine ligase [Bacilli bacterium]|nr:UDP-N-acetylmuramoyl-tripeptide--D-alanyl-D-alanine ligase [Bacilli bacterium]
MIILYILIIMSCSYAIMYKTLRNVHMLQQNLYNENNRYLKWVFKNSNQWIGFDLFLIGICFVGCIWVHDMEIVSVLCFILGSLFMILIGYRWYHLIKTDQNKKKLVFTGRVKRLLFTITLIYFIPLFFDALIVNTVQGTWVVFLIESLLLYFNSIVVFIAMLINWPIENGIYLHYKKKAQNKLKSMNRLKIIGITGSYGKTSCKNVLATILNSKYNTLPSPKNWNTFNGLIMTVNNYMDKFTDIFIAEMGAYVKGEIKRLCHLIHPKYGIITTIGQAHLESFGSQENIQIGKFELIESLPSDGFGILNGDDPLQLSYQIKNPVRIIWIGIDNPDVDVRASNIKCSNKGTTFDVVFKGDKKTYSFETKLLGKHNVYNILAALACGREFEIEPDDLIHAVKSVKPVEHRLELKKIGNFYEIDDAYNANPVGAKRALEVLDMMPGTKVIVTPGMIELGEQEYKLNKEFGKQISDVADVVILIGEKKTKPIKEGLLEKGFDKENIIVFNDVRDAFPFIGNMAINEEVYALFENDLPDTFNEK